MPLNTKHRFFNDGEEDVEFVAEVRPGHENFEKCVYLFYGLANDGYCDEKGLPTRMLYLCLLGQMGDTQWPGLLGYVGNLFTKAVAAYARWTGAEEELLKRYWY